jgi:hypothetical protein
MTLYKRDFRVWRLAVLTGSSFLHWLQRRGIQFYGEASGELRFSLINLSQYYLPSRSSDKRGSTQH